MITSGMLSEDSMQSQGGKARAEALTAEQRTEIAAKAAKARWDLPQATHSGPLTIGDMVLPASVLSDGTRILTQSDFMSGMGMYYSGWVAKNRPKDVPADLPHFLAFESLKPYIERHLGDLQSIVVKYRTEKGAVAHGIKAEIIPKICEVWLDADEEGNLGKRQKLIAKKAKLIIRALAHIGIIALVDEATGYQEVRDKAALAKILERYLDQEARKWEKMFQIDYYRELFRLQGWTFNPDTNARTPYLGKITNNIIYDRLQPGILKKLNELNPRIETSTGKLRRKHTFHQFFTGEVGIPELKEHLSNVTVLMKVAKDWDQFIEMLDRVKPRVGDTLKLPLEFDLK